MQYWKKILMFLAREFKQYVPSISASDISRGPAGVRAMAMNTEGDLIKEFIFDSPPEVNSELIISINWLPIHPHHFFQTSPLAKRVLHCRNAPSPAATSSLAIARSMANKVADNFDLPKREKAQLYWTNPRNPYTCTGHLVLNMSNHILWLSYTADWCACLEEEYQWTSTISTLLYWQAVT